MVSKAVTYDNNIVFKAYEVDHPPPHVHVFRGNKEIGRFNVRDQKKMDDFKMTKEIKQALKEEGYLSR